MLSSINVNYYFLTFTIPKELETIAIDNKRLVLDLLFKASWYAVEKFFKAKGATPGAIFQLQTAGRWLNWHPHIHGICTNGGLTLDKSIWIDVYLPAKAIGHYFKVKFIKLLRKAYKDGLLITNFSTYNQFNKFLDEQYQKHWQFDKSDPIQRVRAVILYISRYLLKPPISDTRIHWYNYKTVCFTYKHHLTNGKSKAFLSLKEFFSRLIEHVQLPYFHMTRNYGIFASRSKKELLEKAKHLIPIDYGTTILWIREPKRLFRERTRAKTGTDPLVCKKCNTELELIEVFFRRQLKVSFEKLIEQFRAARCPPINSFVTN